jgi:hypothetical protein
MGGVSESSYALSNGEATGSADVRSLLLGTRSGCPSVGAPISASKQRQSPAGRGELVGDGEVCGDERAAVGRALDPELPVEGGKPVGQPDEPAPVG